MQPLHSPQQPKKRQTSSLQRRIQCYPPPGLYSLLVRYAEKNGLSNSEAVVHMARCYLATNSTSPLHPHPLPPLPKGMRGTYDDDTK